jgi:hypothetical protein
MLNVETTNKCQQRNISSMHKALMAYKTPIVIGRRKCIYESLEEAMNQATI